METHAGKAPGEAAAKGTLLAATCIFGTIGVFTRYIPLPSSVLALARGCIGAVFLLCAALVGRRRVGWADMRRNLPVLCLSGACIGFNWILLFEAYRFTTVATATLCYYLAPIFVMIASPFLLKERLRPVQALCVFAALCGMALVSGVFGQGGQAGGNGTGILLGIGAAALYACVVLLNKRLTAITPFDSAIVQLGAAAVTLAPYTLLTENVTALTLSPRAVVLVLIVGVLHTGVAYALYFSSVQRLKAQSVALFSYVDPIVAILLSALLLKERMGAAGVAGAALILGATLLGELTGGGPTRGKEVGKN